MGHTDPAELLPAEVLPMPSSGPEALRVRVGLSSARLVLPPDDEQGGGEEDDDPAARDEEAAAHDEHAGALVEHGAHRLHGQPHGDGLHLVDGHGGEPRVESAALLHVVVEQEGGAEQGIPHQVADLRKEQEVLAYREHHTAMWLRLDEDSLDMSRWTPTWAPSMSSVSASWKRTCRSVMCLEKLAWNGTCVASSSLALDVCARSGSRGGWEGGRGGGQLGSARGTSHVRTGSPSRIASATYSPLVPPDVEPGPPHAGQDVGVRRERDGLDVHVLDLAERRRALRQRLQLVFPTTACPRPAAAPAARLRGAVLLHAQAEEHVLQRLAVVLGHHAVRAFLVEQPAAPHQAHQAGLPRLLDVVRRDDDRGARRARQLHQEVPDAAGSSKEILLWWPPHRNKVPRLKVHVDVPLPEDGVDADGGLVQDEEWRRVQQRDGQGHALPLAAAQVAQQPALLGRDLEELEQLVGARADAVGSEARHPAEGLAGPGCEAGPCAGLQRGRRRRQDWPVLDLEGLRFVHHGAADFRQILSDLTLFPFCTYAHT
ncbi:Defensin-like protein 220 [Frankliniella fusca]|uniref:Defensin-like protein 220 n=1 Tax=Frankliniella fusca TaxID=407009 RepID=A0AAE1LBM7_9NEOP|nr:Defensin-like protein 220 [Frankliniella fusca]